MAQRQDRREEEAKHEEDFEQMHALELQVDVKISDAIRHAETTITDAKAEISTVTRLLSENLSLMERIKLQLEGVKPEEKAVAGARMQEVKQNLSQLEKRQSNAKKMIRMQTDEVCRLQEFKKVRVSRLASSYLPNPSDAAHTGMLHTQ